MRSRAAALVVTLGLSAALGAACSSNDDEPTVGAGSSTEASVDDAPHNDADVAFAQGMIPHHEQALEMAALAADNAADERVEDLAGQIEAAQDPEIQEMQAWLAAWGEDPAADAEHGGGHEDGSGGMMSEEDMTALEEATGAEFDRMFLEMMIEHHTGAIEMAETEIADGEFPDAIELAEAITSAQEAEITEMEALLEELPA